MILLYRQRDPVLAKKLMAREQVAFALNRARCSAEAKKALMALIAFAAHPARPMAGSRWTALEPLARPTEA